MGTRLEPGRSQIPVLTSKPQQPPLRVNPNHPLQSSLPGALKDVQHSPVSNAERENGVVRTASRRRRASGSNQIRHATKPVISEAPKAIPTSVQPSSETAPSPSIASNNLASFAARARAAPNDLLPSPVQNNNSDQSFLTTKPARRHSINRPPGAVYSEIRGTERKLRSLPRTDPSSPQLASNVATSRQHQSPETSPAKIVPPTTSSANPIDDAADSKARLSTRRISAGATESKTEWASNRSPLQRLEVRLNDISKEEKRARVEEAEHLLKTSKMGDKPHAQVQEVNSNFSQQPVRHMPIGVEDQQEQNSSKGQKSRHSGHPSKSCDVSKDNPRQNILGGSSGIRHPERQLNKKELRIDIQSKVDDSPVTHRKPRSSNRPLQSSGKPEASSEVMQQTDRGVRFESDGQGDNPILGNNVQNDHRLKKPLDPRSKPLSKNPDNPMLLEKTDVSAQNRVQHGKEAESLYHKKVLPPKQDLRDDKSPSASLSTQRRLDQTVGKSASDRITNPKTSVFESETSQRRAGTEARKKFEPDNSPNERMPTHRKHQLSDILHHQKQSEGLINADSQMKPRQLEEWRNGGTARLTATDFLVSKDAHSSHKAWWERDRSNINSQSPRALSNNAKKGQSFDGSHDGKTQTFYSPQTGSSHASDNSVVKDESIHARPYVTTDDHPHLRWRDRSWLEGHASILGFLAKDDPRFNLSNTYSYSCPHLAEHDPSHIDHICKPYLSKELTQSMRSVRIRTVPSPASFNPPLYLKCGPLLRYTGLKRDRLRHPEERGIRSTTERETWRGSVMIVTVDADSSYNPPPVLSLFPEPMDLLPPPPPQADEGSSNSLPSEYVDPIAGLPKLSRTGTTIYVKPVEDLEEGVDLSRIEDDSGLFEETRTAAVPTSYGRPKTYPVSDISSSPSSAKTRLRGKVGPNRSQQVSGIRLHAERGVTFWRFNLEVELGDQQARVAYRINKSASVGFWVPARGKSMNIMFHSCNGFSLNVK